MNTQGMTKTFVIEGYASLFGQKDRGNDVVEKGAFTKSIKGRSTNRIAGGRCGVSYASCRYRTPP